MGLTKVTYPTVASANTNKHTATSGDTNNKKGRA